MAFDKTPTSWLGAGYSLGTNQAIFNTAAHATVCLPELSNSAGHATTGDIRTIAYAIVDKLYSAWLAQAAEDRPIRMTVSRATSEDSAGHTIRDFNFRFYLDGTTVLTVIPE